MAGLFCLKYANLQAKEIHNQPNSSQSSLPYSHKIELDSSTTGSVSMPALRATRRISIPFGFQTPLPIMNAGHDVIASGHGGCTANEQATVAITITQSISGAIAIGEDVHTCTGQLHIWSSVVTVDTSAKFTDGAAEACGFATTRDSDGAITDTYQWCRDVALVSLKQYIYLPLYFKE